VFSPENRDVEHQNGRTDKNGRFAFCPETSGKWLVTVNDGMGHAVRAEIEVSAGSGPTETAKGAAGNNSNAMEETSKGIKTLFGLSILLNFFLGLYVWKSRSVKR
jgi:nickel transport protein